MSEDNDFLPWTGAFSRQHFLKLAGRSAVGLSAAAALGNLGRLPSAAAALRRAGATPSNTLTIGIAGDPSTLDPEYGQAALANEIIKNLYSQWVRYQRVDSGHGYVTADLTKPPVGDALQSYVQQGSKVLLRARKGTLPSGAPLNADTFIFKVARALGVNVGSVFDFKVLGIESLRQVVKKSNSVFEFHLPHPSPILGPILRDQDAGLVDPTVVKQHATRKDKWAHAYVAQHAAPTGAYVLAGYTPGSKLVLQANPHYWGPKPYFSTVVLQEIPNPDDRSLFLKRGAIDIAGGLDLQHATSLKGASGINLLSIPSIGQDMIGFVCTKAPFSDVRVRQAIASAIPYKDIVTSVLKGEAAATQGAWPNRSIYFQSDVPWPYATDIQKAKSLLAAAGQGSGFSFTCQVSSADDDAKALAVPVQSALSQIGVTMNIAPTDPATFATDIFAGNGQAWIQSGLAFYVDDPYYLVNLFYWSKGVINWTKYVNPDMDKLNGLLSRALTPAAKKPLAKQVQTIINRDVPAISLGEINYLLPLRDNIGGILYEPDGLMTYKTFTRKS